MAAAEKVVTVDAFRAETVTADPMGVPFSKKVIVPVGLPPYCPVRVAVKVIWDPIVAGFKLEARPIVVAAVFTCCEKFTELIWNDAEPPYLAEMVWVPGGRAAVVIEAVPPVNVTVPRVEMLLVKITVPVGVPEPGGEVTVAVNVTAWL